MSRIQSLWFGIRLPWISAKTILKDRPLLTLSILPVLITLGVEIWLVSAMQAGIQATLIRYFLAWGWNPNGFGADILLLLSKILLFILSALAFTFLAGLMAVPFNDFLAERAERVAEPPLPQAPTPSWTQRLRFVRIDLMKTLAVGAGTYLGLFIAWIPLINFLVVALTFALITFQFISYPQTRRGLEIRDGARFVWDHLFASLGFGAVTLALFAVPLLSIVALPLSVVGGTLLFARAEGPGKLR